jgi:hypothetical protein
MPERKKDEIVYLSQSVVEYAEVPVQADDDCATCGDQSIVIAPVAQETRNVELSDDEKEAALVAQYVREGDNKKMVELLVSKGFKIGKKEAKDMNLLISFYENYKSE